MAEEIRLEVLFRLIITNGESIGKTMDEKSCFSKLYSDCNNSCFNLSTSAGVTIDSKSKFSYYRISSKID